MALPVRTTMEDIQEVCRYLSTKPTGSTLQQAETVLGARLVDQKRLSAFKSWGLIEETEDGRYKVTDSGRALTKGAAEQKRVLRGIIRDVPPYNAVIERGAHQNEDSLTTTDVASLWHDHFRDQVAHTDKALREQTICFFQVAAGAGLGTLIVGRGGGPTRLALNAEALRQYITQDSDAASEIPTGADQKGSEIPEQPEMAVPAGGRMPTDGATQMLHRHPTGQGIFIAHGRNKKPVEQVKRILDQFKIPYKVAVEEPNLGRPISGKVREVMESCNCAVLIFTADEEFKDKDGNTIWRPSENVVYELGATGYLYDNRIVIIKEENVHSPSNFRDIGYISFEKDNLEARTMDILKELIGFGIVRIST